MSFDLRSYLRERAAAVDALLDRSLPPATARPAALHEAMRHAVLAGGKRLRPILCVAAGEACGGDAACALQAGAAIELLHTYTLVHDDLPAMDDDDLRRGRPTVHVAFGEANAILAGDALLTLAFEWLAAMPAPGLPAQLVLELARAGGHAGVIAGQVEDLAAEGQPPDAERLRYIHAHKTGDLLVAAVRMGGLCAGAGAGDLDRLTRYGQAAGLAFQVADDILNATSTAEKLGKAAGSDATRGKMTYVALHGVERARAEAHRLVDEAVACLAGLPGDAAPLAALARHVVEREN